MNKENNVNAFITPHFHYDYVWCGTADDMGAKTARIIKEALLIMREHPEFRYVIDSVMPLRYFQLHYPGMWEELKQRVKEKRMELVGGMIVAPDTLMPNGESLVRQILYGKKFYKKEFGIEPKVAYFIDTFGQTPQLPQILKKGGFNFFIFVRGARNRNLPQEFLWKGLDGSKIFTHWMYATYTYITPPFTGTILPPIFPFFPIPFTLNMIPQNFKVYRLMKKIFPPSKYLTQWLNRINAGISVIGADMSAGLIYTINNRLTRATSKNVFVLNGTDNVPPSINIIDVVNYLDKKKKNYNIHLALPSEFLKAAKESREKFGVVENYEFSGFPDKFPGTFSNRIRLKQKIRSLENLFYLTELCCSLSYFLLNEPYPSKQIEEAIWRILTSDFHDGICGCHTDNVYRDIRKQLRLTEFQLTRIQRLAFQTLANNYSKSLFSSSKDRSLVVFNPTSTDRTDILKFENPHELNDFIISDAQGRIIPYQYDEISEKRNILMLIEDIPPFSFENLFIEHQKENTQEKNTSKDNTEMATSCHDTLTQIKTSRFILTFEHNKLIKISDSQTDITLESEKYAINELRLVNDRGDSYLHGKLPKKIDTTFDNQIEILEDGPIRIVVLIKSKLKANNKWFGKPVNEISQYIILYKNKKLNRIDFITTFRNNIRNTRIQACFPIPFNAPHFYSEVPYGFYERDTKPRVGSSWEEFKKKFAFYDRIFPVINWMGAFSIKDNKGITLMNKGLPEYEIDSSKGNFFLTLLKSTGYVSSILPGAVPMVLGPFYSIPKAFELDDQEFHYSLVFYDKSVGNAPKTIEAMNYNLPLVSCFADKVISSQVKVGKPFIRIEPSNFVIKSVKKAENSDNLIIRILETSNNPREGKLTFLKHIKSVHITNLIEESVEKLNLINNHTFKFSSKQQSILTFSIEFL